MKWDVELEHPDLDMSLDALSRLALDSPIEHPLAIGIGRVSSSSAMAYCSNIPGTPEDIGDVEMDAHDYDYDPHVSILDDDDDDGDGDDEEEEEDDDDE